MFTHPHCLTQRFRWCWLITASLRCVWLHFVSNTLMPAGYRKNGWESFCGGDELQRRQDLQPVPAQGSYHRRGGRWFGGLGPGCNEVRTRLHSQREDGARRPSLKHAGVSGRSVCAGRSPPALRCRAETSTCTRGCAATGFPWSPSAADAWCARTTCSCAPRDPGTSTPSAPSLTTSTRRWCREKRWVHFHSESLFKGWIQHVLSERSRGGDTRTREVVTPGPVRWWHQDPWGGDTRTREVVTPGPVRCFAAFALVGRQPTDCKHTRHTMCHGLTVSIKGSMVLLSVRWRRVSALVTLVVTANFMGFSFLSVLHIQYVSYMSPRIIDLSHFLVLYGAYRWFWQ